MALISPGVQVSVIDESFYTTAEPGTRPLIVVASAANKRNSSGTGTAVGTLPSNAGKVYTITSQRELAESFGDPVFKIDSNNNPIHAGELNEYGLQAAYSFLGVSNSVLVVRADIDLNELSPQATAPGGEPSNGTFWLDTANSTYGIFEWNGAAATDGGQAFTNKVPSVVLATDVPAAGTGTVGSYAMVVDTDASVVTTPGSVAGPNIVSLYYRSAFTSAGAVGTGAWVKVGTDAWATANATIRARTVPADHVGANVTYAITINGTAITGLTVIAGGNLAAAAATAINNTAGTNVSARVVSGVLEIYNTDAGLDDIAIAGDDLFFSALGIVEGTYPTPKLQISAHTVVPQWKRNLTTYNNGQATGSVWIKTTEPNAGARWRVKSYNSATKLWDQVTAPLYATDAAATAGIDPIGSGLNIAVNSVYVQYDINNTGALDPVAEFRVLRRNTTTTWAALPAGTTTPIYYISATAPSTLTSSGKLWYTSVVDEVDILVNGAPGVGWRGYKQVYTTTNATGPIVSPTRPTTQTNGTTPLADGDLWVDTSDLENYPLLRRWNDSFNRWDLVDVSDQTTENGIVFGDARWSTAGADSAPASITALLSSNFVDFDAPDPALYPQGMLLWNTRRSGFNVKKFVRDYVFTAGDNIRMGNVAMSGYYPHRWVTESGNQADGSGSFGRHAQRKVIIQQLQALVNTNQEIRDTERNGFNLVAVPGYPELIGEMMTLNNDRGLTAFIVGDTPARLNPSATNLNNWATNLAGSVQDDDNGLVSRDEYLGVFYPWGFSSDNFGRDVAVPPSHMILRMMALNDQIAYPWFAPAGTRRGNITNAGAVGYITAEGEFRSVALNDGQRDTLYINAVNPITFFSGAGLVNFGQKTRARNASALDRINVARLVIFLRNQLNKLAKPYIFEPNDKITRDEIKQSIESLLLELVGQRALYDYLVVCDESNNTPNRIDRNELHVDIAIEPVKAVEFIYIPVRLKNTGEIAGLG
jgi:hypothetical protein